MVFCSVERVYVPVAVGRADAPHAVLGESGLGRGRGVVHERLIGEDEKWNVLSGADRDAAAGVWK